MTVNSDRYHRLKFLNGVYIPFRVSTPIYPKQMNVSKAETEITEALNDGALLDDILDGARRYAVYVKHQGWCGDHQYIALPHNWIKGKRWLDSWEVSPKSKIKTEFEVEAQPAKKTTVKDAPRPAKSKTKATSKTTNKAKGQAAFDVFYKQRRECEKNNPECQPANGNFCPTCKKNKELLDSSGFFKYQ